MELGLEAIEAWKTLPFFRDAGVYHQSGWIAMDEKGSDIPRRNRENFCNGGYDGVIVDMKEEQVRRAWGGVLARTDCTPFGSYYFNQSAGWVDAGKALGIMLQEAIKMGVRYETGEVRHIVLSKDGTGVKGVETEAGAILRADKVMLATGAWTSKLMSPLEDELNLPEAQRIERQVSAAGVCVAHFQLSEEEKEVYSELPVLVYGGQGEVIPPTSQGILKFTSTTSFKNTIRTASGQGISVPVVNQVNAPRGLQEDSLAAVRARLPQLLDHGRRKPDYYRLCWDAISANQHPLIDRHVDPRLSNLYFAVGGSFHFFKFLPTIGKYVANVLEGTKNGLDRDTAWAWKSTSAGTRGVHESLIPKKEYKEFI
ncbi:FAD dependent oxidoreductase [Aspergillus heterothallicus]